MPSCAVVSHLLWAHWAGYWADTHHHYHWEDTHTITGQVTGQTHTTTSTGQTLTPLSLGRHTHTSAGQVAGRHTPTLNVRRKEWEICFLFGEEDGYQGEVESVDKC